MSRAARDPWGNKVPEVPDTVSDEQMADLKQRAQRADREPWTSKKAIRRRLSANAQAKNAAWS